MDCLRRCSIILDGEMIEWNPVEKAVVGFGTLKTAANQIKLNPEDKQSSRPVCKCSVKSEVATY